MRLKQIVAIAVLMVGVIACNATSSALELTGVSSAGKAAKGVTIATAAKELNATSSLKNLLYVFATQNAAAWSAFDTVPGVHWRDAKSRSSLQGASPDMSHYRSGSLLRIGFGDVDVPDGKLGAEAGVRKDNEGKVGVTLNGDANDVRSVTLLKFYPSKNYREIIQNQLNDDASVKLIADTCELDYGTTAPNTQMNTFYQIDMSPRAVPVFAEVYVDEDGGNQGPGYTYFADLPEYAQASVNAFIDHLATGDTAHLLRELPLAAGTAQTPLKAMAWGEHQPVARQDAMSLQKRTLH